MKRILDKVNFIVRNEGIVKLVKQIMVYIDRKRTPDKYFHTINMPKDNKFLLFVSGEPKNSTSFYRCEIPKEQLSILGYESDIVHKDFVDPSIFSKYKHIIWYRLPYNKELVEASKKEVIFSVDDLLFDLESVQNQRWLSNLPEADREVMYQDSEGIREFIRNSDRAIVSTPYLKEKLQGIKKMKTLVYRNSFSTKQFEIGRSSRKSDVSRIITFASGSYTHDDNFDLVADDLYRLLNENTEIKLKLVGRVRIPDSLKQFSNRIIRKPHLNPVDYIKELADSYLIINPLVKNDHNESKSELRAIQAGLVSVPILATDTEVYSELLKDIDETFLIRDDENWHDQIFDLFESDRTDLGSKLHDYIVEKYDYEELGKELVNFLEKI